MSEVISILLTLVTAAYVFQTVYLIIGLKKAAKVSTVDDYEPTVSVIVAARNEEEHIGKCISSLLNLDYPKEKLEILIVDDRSSDQTSDIVEKFDKEYSNLRLLTAEPSTGNLLGKTNAITKGINASKGEILMFTDADCTVQSSWVRESVRYFDNETGIVGGFTVLEAARTFEGIQAIDWLYHFGVPSASSGWNFPLTVIGNNICVRREAYNQTGGYENIPFSVTEDYALVQAIAQKTKFGIRFPLNSKTIVQSKACTNILQLFRQKQRWAVGGLDMVAKGMLVLSIVWAAKLSFFLSLFVEVPYFTLLTFLLQSLLDYFFLHIISKKGNVSMKYFIFFEFYFFVYVLIIPLVAIFSKKVIWKERSL